MTDLRPQTIDEFVGQEQIKQVLDLALRANQIRGTMFPHILLHGPAGFGKTTLAHIIANEMNYDVIQIMGPNVEGSEDITNQVWERHSQGEQVCLFIDEIHRLGKRVQEMMYVLMEDFEIEIKESSGTTRIPVPNFCLIGATTEFGTLSPPMRDRFGIIGSIGSYTQDNLSDIVARNVLRLGKSIESTESFDLAGRSRGTPRTAIRLVNVCNDWCDVHNEIIISSNVVEKSMNMLQIDNLGLTEDDRNYLITLLMIFGGGPAGIDALSLATNIDSTTISEVIEPHLLRNRLISRESKGRVTTALAIQHLDMKIKKLS